MQFKDLAGQFTVKELPQSEVELAGEVPAEALAPYRAQALAHLSEHLELPGFRPGKVPQDLALKKVGEVAVLEEAAELFVKDFYPELIEIKGLDVVGRPDIRITKLAPGNPAGFVMRTSVYPKVEVPKGWAKLAAEVPLEPAAPATGEEVEQTLASLQKNRAEADAHKNGATPILDAEGKPLPPALPELNDAFAQSVGAFKTLDELKEQITKGITEEKARTARDVRRGKLVERLLEQTALEVPPVFVDSELDKIMAQMSEDVQRFGMSWDDYLKRVNKTEESIREEFKEQATKRAKLQLVLNQLAADEKVEADKGAADEEMKHALEHFPDANPQLLRIHIETVLRNEQVLQLLEGVPKKE